MSDLPTLVVDGDPILWHGISASGIPHRATVRVDDLPTVTEAWPTDDDGVFVRQLRVGDRVTLATECCADPETCRTFTDPGCCWGPVGDGTVPFATATVARIVNHGTGYFVTVTAYTDVEGQKSLDSLSASD